MELEGQAVSLTHQMGGTVSRRGTWEVSGKERNQMGQNLKPKMQGASRELSAMQKFPMPGPEGYREEEWKVCSVLSIKHIEERIRQFEQNTMRQNPELPSAENEAADWMDYPEHEENMGKLLAKAKANQSDGEKGWTNGKA